MEGIRYGMIDIGGGNLEIVTALGIELKNIILWNWVPSLLPNSCTVIRWPNKNCRNCPNISDVPEGGI